MTTAAFASTTVGELVARKPGLAKLFERLKIDYCCGGRDTLEKACLERKLDPATVMTMIEALDQPSADMPVDVSSMSMTQLADHIEATHHRYLKEELPRLDPLIRRVADRHLDKNPRLMELVSVFSGMAQEMFSHMAKEEQVLFPAIRRLESAAASSGQPAMNLSGPVAMMEHEHQQAGNDLARMRELTDGYTTPPGGCNTYRGVMHSLEQLERDMHQHVHKENNVLFPEALRVSSAARL